MTSFEELRQLMEYMRSERGCAWDRKQKISDFKKYLREESQEALDAIEKDDMENLCEELGDLLWHVLFISQIAKEKDYFTVEDVMNGLKDKIVRRHPHIFSDEKCDLSAEEVEKAYRRIKESEGKK